VSSEQELILASCCFSPMKRNSVFEVLCQKVGRHLGGCSLQSILEVGDAGVKVRLVKEEKKLYIVSINVMVKKER